MCLVLNKIIREKEIHTYLNIIQIPTSFVNFSARFSEIFCQIFANNIFVLQKLLEISIACQLRETCLKCHSASCCHRNIYTQKVLVSQVNYTSQWYFMLFTNILPVHQDHRKYPSQFGMGWILKGPQNTFANWFEIFFRQFYWYIFVILANKC